MMKACGIAVCVALAGLAIFPALAWDVGPDQPGTYAFGVYGTEFEDEARSRSMGLLVYYLLGKDDVPLESRPLVVFNHGFLLTSRDYRSCGQHVASHRFAVALPSFPTSFLSVHHVRLAEDVSSVIDCLIDATTNESHPLFGAIDPEWIGGSGHSLGGKLSLLKAGTEDRVKAIGVLDPVDEGNPIWNNPERYPSVVPELMPEPKVPLLLVGAELESVVTTFSPCDPADENYRQSYEDADLPAIEIAQLDVVHSQYVDEEAADEDSPCARGDVPSEWVRTSSASYLTAFFLGHIGGCSEALDWLDARLLEEEDEGLILVRRKS